MLTPFPTLLLILAGIGTVSSTVFLSLALIGAIKFRRDSALQKSEAHSLGTENLPPVSILKPLHGLEPRMEQNLESFFRQNYAKFEVLFAVDNESDTALPVIREVCARHPDVPSKILLTGAPPWPNPPAYKFARLADEAQFDIFVTSDSDVRVGPDYVREVVTPLLHPGTGMTTCIYRGESAGGLWSLLDAIGMSVEMSAGVLTAYLLEGIKFGLGPSIAVRRDALEAIGGYEATGHSISNDFVTGNLIAERGYEVALSRNVIDHVVPPMTFRRMWSHQLRWATGTKYSRPKGHLGTGLVFAMPYGILGLFAGLLLGRPLPGILLLAWAIVNRITESIAIGYGVARDPECLKKCWLYPLRDLLGFALWVASYISSTAMWRRGDFEIVEGGRIVRRPGYRVG